MQANIVVLPGDGIGPEITVAAVEVLKTIAARFGHDFTFSEHDIGGIAIDKHGEPLPAVTLSVPAHPAEPNRRAADSTWPDSIRLLDTPAEPGGRSVSPDG